MPHLNLEDIARLIEEPPAPNEAAHLDACEACRRELDAMRADTAALASLPPIAPPAEEWPAIEARLAQEGLIRPAHQPAHQPDHRPDHRIVPRVRSWRAGLLRAAAVAAVFLAGTLSGAAWTGSEDADPVGTASADVAPQDRFLSVAREPRNAEEAAQLAREIEALYFNTLVSATEARPLQEAGGDPVARLAALEGIMTLTGTALDQAPADPILNGYHLAAIAQREATLNQMASQAGESWF